MIDLVFFGFTFNVILWGSLNPCVAAVATVTKFLSTLPVRTVWFVVKLWVSPVPTLLKNSVVDIVFARPTKVPVDPRPTLIVAIPIRSSLILATNSDWPSARVVPTPTFVSSCTMIPLPLVPGEYVTWSPVRRLWFLI